MDGTDAQVEDPASDARPWQVERDAENDRDILILAVLVLVLASLFQVTPARDGVTVFGAQLPEVCGMKRLEWGECPGCGLTRSFVLGVRLDPEAFRLHPAGPLLLLVLVAQIPYRGARWWRRRGLEREGLVDLRGERLARWRKLLWWSLPGAVLAGWLLKLVWL